MATTVNDCTVPLSGNSTSSSVGTPQAGHEPLGGMYTLLQRGQRWPLSTPSLMRVRNRAGALPAVK